MTTKANEKLTNGIINVMCDTGRMSRSKHRLSVDNVSYQSSSDWARVECYIYRGRSKKPFVYWNLAINMAREIVDFEHSTFCYL